LDLQAEARLAALLAKGTSGDATTAHAFDMLEAATLGGARALGLERRVGSIEVGKEADLCAYALDRVETQPCFDPVSHWLYAAGREHVSDVWVAGTHVVRERRVVTADDTELTSSVLNPVAAWQNKSRSLLK
jgi:5-methylthioadenosine/S-adenosylhomocysteine deaminase